MITRVSKGLGKDQTEDLWSLVFGFKDIWTVALTNDGPAKVKPCKVHLIPGAVPGKAKMRRYARARLNFMYSQVPKLEKLGYVKSNPGSW